MNARDTFRLALSVSAFLFMLGCSTASPSAKLDRPDEMIPSQLMEPVDIGQLLVIYAKFTGAQLDISQDVRQLPAMIYFDGSCPAMTRAQAVDMLDAALLKAGVVVTHHGPKHAVFRLETASR